MAAARNFSSDCRATTWEFRARAWRARRAARLQNSPVCNSQPKEMARLVPFTALLCALCAVSTASSVHPHGRKLDVGGGTPWEQSSELILERILGRFDRNSDAKLVLTEFNNFLEAVGCQKQSQSEFFGLLSACPFLDGIPCGPKARAMPAEFLALSLQHRVTEDDGHHHLKFHFTCKVDADELLALSKAYFSR